MLIYTLGEMFFGILFVVLIFALGAYWMYRKFINGIIKLFGGKP
jgi:hypothetical protein